MTNWTVGINQRANEYYGNYHRIVWQRYNGEIPKEHMIHHINGKKRDNRIENLELVNRIEHGKRIKELNRLKVPIIA